MTWAGSRVACAIGEDYRALRWLALRTGAGVPWSALLWQTGIAAALLLTATFQQVLLAAEVVLLASSGATVAGTVWLRRKQPGLPRPVRAWGYPVTPLLFLAVTGWMLWHAATQNPGESLAGLAVLASGAALAVTLRPGETRAGRRG
jgi:APA family basic amino acid/polyamine antiporter